MNKNNKILILNSGGTFNKIYNQLNGQLEIQQNNQNIKQILESSKISDCKVDSILYKDSLDINSKDRAKIINYIQKSNFKKIIIIHGTDTINKTAKLIKKKIFDKTIVLTGAMLPFSINPIEATANLIGAYSFIKYKNKKDIYISMHGNTKKYNKIKKNRTLGIFECQ